MFTGIIEEIGHVEKIDQSGNAIKMTIAAKNIMKDIQLGDSIAINGVCLTVTSFSNHAFTVDVMPETIKASSLSQLSRGSIVNLERAMSGQGRFGGHFVSGHVDGIGKIVKKTPVDNAVYYDIETDQNLLKYMILKGSVSVDGASLTIFGLTTKTFTISLIPHTLSQTILGEKHVGDIINIECDLIAKYIEKFTANKESQLQAQPSITESFLEQHGFKA